MIEIHAGWLTLGTVLVFAVAWLGSATVAALATRSDRKPRLDPSKPVPQGEPALPATKVELDHVIGVLQRVAAEVDRQRGDLNVMNNTVADTAQMTRNLYVSHQELARWVHSIPQQPAHPTPTLGRFIGGQEPTSVEIANHAAVLAAQQEAVAAAEAKKGKKSPPTS